MLHMLGKYPFPIWSLSLRWWDTNVTPKNGIYVHCNGMIRCRRNTDCLFSRSWNILKLTLTKLIRKQLESSLKLPEARVAFCLLDPHWLVKKLACCDLNPHWFVQKLACCDLNHWIWIIGFESLDLNHWIIWNRQSLKWLYWLWYVARCVRVLEFFIKIGNPKASPITARKSI